MKPLILTLGYIEEQENTNSFLNPVAVHGLFSAEKIEIVRKPVQELLEKKETFYYPIGLTEDVFHKTPFLLPSLLLSAIETGRCKILVLFPSEGYISSDIFCDMYFDWFNRFSSVNNLDHTTLVFIHSNLKLHTTVFTNASYKILNFTYFPVNYFEYMHWFLDLATPAKIEDRERIRKPLGTFLEENRKKRFLKHFSILNRMPRIHRVLLFSEVQTTTSLKESSFISLGCFAKKTPNVWQVVDKENTVRFLESFFNTYPNYKKNLEFIKAYNFKIPVELDTNLSINQASSFNRDNYRDTFLSVITETLIDTNTLFFSEKTYKPIYNLHPFILLGNPYSLKKLRQDGYITFDRWWDESYDEEEDLFLRIKKISEVMQRIATWSHEKCYKVTQEMEEVLVHNFNNLLENTRYEEFIKRLVEFHPPLQPQSNKKRRII